jgi:hypothetical protein
VVDLKTNREIYEPPAQDRSARWDARNDSPYCFIVGSDIQKVDVAAHKVSTLVDYLRDGHHFSSIQSGGPGDTSKDNWLRMSIRSARWTSITSAPTAPITRTSPACPSGSFTLP